jgi:hypothetical protein
MAQTTANDETMADPFAVSEFTRWAALAERLCQEAVQRQIACDLAAGHPIPYAGTGAEAGKVFQRLPDGRRIEIRVREDGSAEFVRQVP